MKIIAGTHKNKNIIAPKGMGVRPTSSRLRETVFNILQSRVENALFLDLFSGSGAMGLEALSRGAKHTTFVDEGKESILALKKNLEAFDLKEKSIAFHDDVRKALRHFQKNRKTFDIIYVDPPYGLKTGDVLLSAEVLGLIDTCNLLGRDGVLMIEEGKRADLETLPLTNLRLKDKRINGKTVLYQFETIK